MKLKRLFLPVGTLIAVWLIHLIGLWYFPEERDHFSSLAEFWHSYIENQSYFMSYSYMLSLVFAVVAFRQYRERKSCPARNMALGAIGFSGVLSVTGCFLLGCCGSPMLSVYLSLFGAAFLPFAKPFIAALTTVLIGASWYWMHRKTSAPSQAVAHCGCNDPPN